MRPHPYACLRQIRDNTCRAGDQLTACPLSLPCSPTRSPRSEPQLEPIEPWKPVIGLAFGFLLILARAHIARSFWAMPPWLELRATPGYLKVARLTCAFVGPFTVACYASLLLVLVPERFG